MSLDAAAASLADVNDPTLADLLAAPQLGLRLVVGDEASTRRTVRGAHAIDLPRPGLWLGKGWVLLTVGSAIAAGDATEHEAYVANIVDAGVSALGVGVGPVLDEVPETLLHAARRSGLPVFTVAPETPFRSVVSFVHGVSSDVLSRRLLMRSRLMSCLASTFPERALVGHVSRLLNRDVCMLDQGGHVIALVGARRPDEDEFGRTYDIAWTGPDATLRVVMPAFDLDNAEVREVLDALQEVLGLFSRHASLVNDERRLARAELLDAMTGPSVGQNAFRLERRLRMQGIDLDTSCVTLAMAPRPSLGQRIDPLIELEGLAQAASTAHLLAEHPGFVLGVFQVGAGLDAFIDALRREWHVGIGPVFGALEDTAASARSAQAALREASLRAASGGDGVVDHADLRLAAWLIALSDPEYLTDRARHRLQPLRDQPLLLEAVSAYLSNELDATKAAQQLHLHPNSMRYRLGRAEVLLDGKLRSPGIVADLYLAFNVVGWPDTA